MEPLFRKHFWIFTATFVALAALIAAWTASELIGWKIGRARITAKGRAPAPPARPPAALDADRLARLSGMPPPPKEESEIAPAADPDAAPVRTSLPVKLLGTLVASEPRWSIATVQDLATQRSASYLIGEQLQGAEVLAISRGEVLIRNAGRRELITAQPPELAQPATPGAPAPSGASPAPVAVGPRVLEPTGIRATGENQYEIPRKELDRTLSNLNTVAMQARIVPAFKDGAAQGFKLFSIQPDSIYAKIGLVNGDVVRRINGSDLNSPERALELYSKLKDAGRVDIELERNGSLVHKSYTLR